MAVKKSVFNSKRIFPNGMSKADYSGYEKWSKRRWAWEFLCRNENFRKACDELDEIPEGERKERRKEKIAHDFHLRKFKSAFESYGKNKNYPTFIEVKGWGWRHCEIDKSKQAIYYEYRRHEVFVRFDLESILIDSKSARYQTKKALDFLLEEAKFLKNKRNEELRKEEDLPNRKPKGGREERLQRLRCLDSNRAKMKSSDAFKAIFPDKAQTIDPSLYSKEYGNQKRNAETLAESGYLALLLEGMSLDNKKHGSGTIKQRD